MKIEREDRPEPAPEDGALQQALDRAAELERVIVTEARGSSSSPAELRAVEAALQRAESPRARGHGLRIALAAAGLLLAALLGWRFLSNGQGESSPGTVLGSGDAVEILAPKDAVDAFTVIRWRAATSGARRFEVRVLDAATGAVLLREPDLQGSELALDERDTSTWQRIHVEIDELDSSRETVNSARVEAWRRSR